VPEFVSKPYVIVWDLDGTLGRFDALNGQGDSPHPIDVRVRPHLREALEQLAGLGFRHTLLTLATPYYAELVLHGLGLRELFEHVEGQGQRGKGDAAGVAQILDVASAEMPARMLFVGDHPLHDEPRDPRVLFHLEMFALERSARDLVLLVRALLDLGGGSLRDGFEELARRRAWWERMLFWRRALPVDRPCRRVLPGLDALLMMRRREDCPVIAFAQPPTLTAAEQMAIVPADHSGRISSRLENRITPGGA
jgi:hypothetical protein